MLEYKGYLGTVKYNAEDHCLYGKIAYIRDLIHYEATNVDELEKEFKSAVDDYLTDCAKLGKPPNKLFKGSFNVHIGPDLHRKAVIASGEKSLISFVCEAIREKLEQHDS